MTKLTILNCLQTQPVLQAFYLVSTVEAVRSTLRSLEPVTTLHRLIAEDKISPEDLERDIEILADDFEKGYAFKHRSVFCALAVAVEGIQSDLAMKVLNEFKELNYEETYMVYKVAELCLKFNTPIEGSGGSNLEQDEWIVRKKKSVFSGFYKDQSIDSKSSQSSRKDNHIDPKIVNQLLDSVKSSKITITYKKKITPSSYCNLKPQNTDHINMDDMIDASKAA